MVYTLVRTNYRIFSISNFKESLKSNLVKDYYILVFL